MEACVARTARSMAMAALRHFVRAGATAIVGANDIEAAESDALRDVRNEVVGKIDNAIGLAGELTRVTDAGVRTPHRYLLFPGQDTTRRRPSTRNMMPSIYEL